MQVKNKICAYSSIQMNLNRIKERAITNPQKEVRNTKFPVMLSILPSRELIVVTVETHKTGSRIGKEITVKREPFPPDLATMAARIVVADEMAKPPAIMVKMKA